MNKKNKLTKVLLTVLNLCIFFGILFSATPNKVNYQGVLKEKGQLVTGTRKMRFSIYDAATGGNLKWSSGVVDVEVKNGVFRYVLNLPSDFDWSKGTYYLEVKVEDTVLTPREEIKSSIYAIHSKEAEIAKEAQSVDWSDIKNKPPEFSGGELSANSIGSYHIIDSTITDADISPQANISWSKISKSGSSLGDLGGILPADKLSGSYLNDVKVSSAIHAEVASSVVGSVSAEQDLDMKGHNILNLSTITAQSEGIYLASNVFVTQGNFGIGTTGPSQKLHVAGKLQVGDDDTPPTAGAIRWKGTNFEGFDGFVWKTLDVQATSGGGWTEDAAGNRVYLTNSGRKVGIGTTAPTSRLHVRSIDTIEGAMRVDNPGGNAIVYVSTTGNVGIGTTGPAARLDVVGFTGTSPVLRVSTAAVGGDSIVVSTTGNVGIGTTAPTRRLWVNGDAGGTSSWYNDSDERLKKNITQIDNGLDKVMRLRGVYFEWKDTTNHPEGRQVGLIAQEVEKVVPEVVDKKGEYYSIATANLVPVLIEAIKEQQKEIEKLRLEIEELRKQR